jgi:hypothetical protein
VTVKLKSVGLGAVFGLSLGCCNTPENRPSTPPIESTRSAPGEPLTVPPTEIQLRHDLTLEVAREAAEPPSGSDAPPISTLRLKQADGKSKLLD